MLKKSWSYMFVSLCLVLAGCAQPGLTTVKSADLQMRARSVVAQVIMFEAFFKADIDILRSSTRITHVVCQLPVPHQTISDSWRDRLATYRYALKTLPRRIMIVVRYHPIPAYSRELGTRIHPARPAWYRELRRWVRRTIASAGRPIQTMSSFEVQGYAQELHGYDVYDVHEVTAAMIAGGFGPFGFQSDWAVPSALRRERVEIAAAPAAQSNSYRQHWAARTMGRWLVAPVYWHDSDLRLLRLPSGSVAQLVLQDRYGTSQQAVAMIDANKGISFYLFPHTNNSTSRAAEIVKLLR